MVMLLGMLVATGASAQTSVRLVSGTVRYQASDARDTWQGSAPVSSLEWHINLEHLPAFTLRVRVNPADFSSGNLIRDANARRSVFETGRYPEIVLTGERFVAQSTRLQDGQSLSGTLTGTLTMHGVAQTIRIPVELTRNDNRIAVESNFSVLLSDFAMTRPSFLGLTVDDEVQLTVTVVGELEP
jgi:polyisoprenoid-binding protein YceI